MSDADEQDIDVMYGLKNVLSQIEAAVAKRSKVKYNASYVWLVCNLNKLYSTVFYMDRPSPQISS